MSDVERKVAPAMSKEKITNAVLELLTRGKVPQAYNTAYQVACVIAVLYDATALGEMCNAMAHHMARIFSVLGYNVDGWAEPIASVCSDVKERVAKAIEAEKAKESAPK